MAEWLILSLLVPAIVVPVVLLFGFAGCDRVFLDPRDPVIVSIEPISPSVIRLIWIINGESTEFRRTRLPDPNLPPPPPGDPDYVPKNFTPPSNVSQYDDEGRARGTTYEYLARTHDFGETSDWVGPFRATTDANFAILPMVPQDDGFGNVDTNTVKCEIAAADLIVPPFTPVQMWISLGQRASVLETVTFSKVFIGHKAAAGNPWDAVALTQVLFNGGSATVMVPPGGVGRSDPIASFVWNGTSALIVSMYFVGGPSADQLSARTIGASATYMKNGIDEAAVAAPTGYTPFAGYLSGVVKIEVGES